MKHVHFFKRAAAILLSSVLLLILSACSQNGGASGVLDSTAASSGEPASSSSGIQLPAPADTSTAAATGDTPADSSEATPSDTSPASPLSTYQLVLQNKAEFFSTDVNKKLNISQLNQAVSDDSSVTSKATKFTVIDLENDGTPEVILRLSVNNNDDYGFEVLHYQDGAVYGYTLWYRAFMDLKADGTFSFSGGAADYGFGTVKFTEKAYSVDKISYCESSYDSSNNQSISYFVDHESASEDDFLSAISKQSEKTEATWSDFTDDNIKTMLSDFK